MGGPRRFSQPTPARSDWPSGEAATPFGEAGRRLEIYLDDCVNRARVSIKLRLRPNLRMQDLPGAQ